MEQNERPKISIFDEFIEIELFLICRIRIAKLHNHSFDNWHAKFDNDQVQLKSKVSVWKWNSG